MIKIFRERVGLRTIRSRRKEGIKQLSGNRILLCSVSDSNQNVHRRISEQSFEQNFARADPWKRLEAKVAESSLMSVCFSRKAKIVPAAAAQSIFSLYFPVYFPSASISALETTGLRLRWVSIAPPEH